MAQSEVEVSSTEKKVEICMKYEHSVWKGMKYEHSVLHKKAYHEVAHYIVEVNACQWVNHINCLQDSGSSSSMLGLFSKITETNNWTKKPWMNA